MLKVNSLTGFGGGKSSLPLVGYGGRGLFGGGSYWTSSAIVDAGADYITIATAGNATLFGDLTVARSYLAACSDGGKGVFGGGYNSVGSTVVSDVIDYFTIASAGNATDFGDLTVARSDFAACSDASRGVFGGGNDAGWLSVDTLDYITIASAANATDFGDLTLTMYQLAACSNATRGVFTSGYNGAHQKQIDYITIASAGNATRFGDQVDQLKMLAACADSTRGVFGGSSLYGQWDQISYITLASTGDATDFGNLTSGRQRLGACSDWLRGVFAGGIVGSTSLRTDVIDYITIASTGNATDFGNLSAFPNATTISGVGRQALAGCSGN
jgi:hypothetical protein